MTTPTGPFHVVRHWSRWSIEDVRDWDKKQPIYDTEAEAQAEADQRNEQYAHKNAPRPPRPTQPALFDPQEATG